MDVSGIEAGVDFVELIEQQVQACSVLVALIGRHWLEGNRLRDPNDLVTREIALALKNNASVIPVLLRGAQMPAASDLPEDLKALARKNAVEVGEATFDRDAEALIRALEPRLGKRKLTRKIWVTAASFLVLAGLAVGFYTMSGSKPQRSVESTQGSTGNPPSTGNPALDDLSKAFGNLPVATSGAGSTNPGGSTSTTTAPFEFEPVGTWSVRASGSASGAMLLNLKKDRNYEITNANGALQTMAQTIGSTGTWTFNTTDKRLMLLPTNSTIGYGLLITGKGQNGYTATSNDGVFYTFSRQ